MEFFSRFFGVLLDKWLIPFVLVIVGVVGPFLYSQFKEKGQPEKSELKIIKYGVAAFVILILVTTLILTLAGGDKSSGPDPDIDNDILIEDDTFTTGNRGLASLYDDELIPFWYESDKADVCLNVSVDNYGSSYATIVKSKLIIDDFTPLSIDDILICRLEAYQGVPDVGEAFLDLNSLPTGRSEYDFSFSSYREGDTGKTIPIKQGQSFYIDSLSKMYLSTALSLNRTGIYTYHFELDIKYHKDESLLQTNPVSFIYLDGDYKDYKYNRSKLNSLYLDREYKEYRENDSYESIYYSIEGRTLRIPGEQKVSYNPDIGCFFALIDTIIIEDGAEEIDENALMGIYGLYNVKTIYFPKTLKSLDFDCFYRMHALNLKKIYFGGTKKEWNKLKRNSDSSDINIWGYDAFEDVTIIYNSDITTFENELSNIPVDINPLIFD